MNENGKLTEQDLQRMFGKKHRERKLSTRCHRLKDWLNDNFESGRYFTIEEIVKGVVNREGEPYYKLNTNPKVHDKCIALANDVKQINRKLNDRYIPIVKDDKGSCKLAENKEEIAEYIAGIRKEVEQKCIYCNLIIAKTEMQDAIPFITLAGRVLSQDEMKPVDVFKH